MSERASYPPVMSVVRSKSARTPAGKVAPSAVLRSAAKPRQEGLPVSLLVPAMLLPAEGEEFEAWSPEVMSLRQNGWLGCLTTIGQGRAPQVQLRADEVVLPEDLELAGVLQWVQLTSGEDDEDLPQMEAFPATSHLDWARIATDVTGQIHADHFLASSRELLRVFLEALKAEVEVASAGFLGDAVPIVAARRMDDGSVLVTFLGIWQAGANEVQAMHQRLRVQGWEEGDALGSENCLLLNEAEVEGRALKEAILSLSMLALLANSASAETGLPGGLFSGCSVMAAAGVEPSANQFEVLPVKSQRLTQPPPRVFPTVVASGGCEHKVIVDVKAQRAFVFIDGRLAFETPVSTASKGRITPRGTFKITEKIRSGKRSTLYKSLMPYWMRLDESAIGMHTGNLPGYPASHGCVRMPDESARFIFDLVPKGSIVQVVDSIQPLASPVQEPMVAGR